MQSFKDKDSSILHGVDQSEGHIPQFLQEKGEHISFIVYSPQILQLLEELTFF